LLCLTVPGHHLGTADEKARINAKSPADQAEHDNRTYSDAGTGCREAASIFNSVAGWQLVEAHD
jgi:hypothetical protein